MGESVSASGAQHIGFEAYGVRVRVITNSPEILERLPGLLPPGATPISPTEATGSFGVIAEERGSYRFERDQSPVTQAIDLDFALMLLESQLRIYVGLNAPDWIFVHAGAVAHCGRALILPGRSFSGKTTLVLALVRAGASYYSDDYALIDRDGRVHPYPKPLSIRDHAAVQIDHGVESLGGIAGADPLPIGAVVFTEYRSGARWDPRELTPGQGALALFDNTLAAQDRPAEALAAFRKALRGARLLEGQRGDAEALVPDLMAMLEAQRSR